MVERAPVMTGGCQCGAVRYALFADPTSTFCHCRMCQKAVGGPFAALSKIDKADLVWTRGQPAAYRSSSAAFRDFCAACGTPLTFRFIDAKHMEVTTGSLDRPQDTHPVQASVSRAACRGWRSPSLACPRPPPRSTPSPSARWPATSTPITTRRPVGLLAYSRGSFFCRRRGCRSGTSSRPSSRPR
jgi:hypothetical protein